MYKRQVTEFVFEETGQTLDDSADSAEELSIRNLRDNLNDFNQEFIRSSIPVKGSTVVVRGTDLAEVQTVDVNGEEIAVANDDSFALEYILPPGDHEFKINSKRKSGEQSSHRLDVEVKPGHFFIVGLADLTCLLYTSPSPRD